MLKFGMYNTEGIVHTKFQHTVYSIFTSNALHTKAFDVKIVSFCKGSTELCMYEYWTTVLPVNNALVWCAGFLGHTTTTMCLDHILYLA